MKYYDVVIIGAGAVGSSVALALGQCGRRVLLLEQTSWPSETAWAPLDVKTLALSYASYKIYSALGLKKFFETSSAIKHVRINVQGQFGSCWLSHKTHDVPALGYVVSAPDLAKALYEALAACDTVDVIHNASLNGDLERHPTGWKFGDQFATLLVACDGTHSTWRTQEGIMVDERDYDHSAIMVNLKIAGLPEGVAVERFLHNGAIALLPWQSHGATCVWTLPTAEATRYWQEEADTFQARCQAALGYEWGKIEHMGKRHRAPLKMVVARTPFTSRFLLMGNAAHSLHPIAAQGLNLSLRDVWQMREQVRHATDAIDIGAPEFLTHYAQARAADQARVMATTDRIASWMASHKIPPIWRAVGVALLDGLGPLKYRFTRRSMGLVGG